MSLYFFNLWSIPYLAAFALLFIIVSIFFAKLEKDGKLILYTISLFFMTLAALSAFLATNSNEVDIWKTWSYLILFFGFISMTTFFHFSFLYKGDLGFKDKKYLFLIYIVPIGYLLIFLIRPSILYPDPQEVPAAPFGKFDTAYPSAGFDQIDLIWGIVFMVLIIIMIVPLFNFAEVFRTTEDRIIRKQAAFFILGYTFPLITLPIDYLLVSVFNIKLKLYISMVSLSLTGLLFLFGILGEKLLDPSILVTKAFKYLVTAVIVAFLFAIIENVVVGFIAGNFFENGQIASYISVLIAIFILMPIEGLVDKLFQMREESKEIPAS